MLLEYSVKGALKTAAEIPKFRIIGRNTDLSSIKAGNTTGIKNQWHNRRAE